LTGVEEGPCCSGLEQFSIVLETARTETLPERIFHLTSPSGQVMDLALAPVVGESRRHRAVFSLLA
jgi:hypothetical protein